MPKYFLIFFMILFAGNQLYAQRPSTRSKKAAELFSKAENAYIQGNTGPAVNYLQQALKKDNNFKEAYLLLADIYFSKQEFAKEVEMLKKAVSIDSSFFVNAYYNLGVANFYLGKRDETIYWMKKYKERSAGKRGRLDADRWIKQAEFADDAVKNPTAFNPVNLGPAVNSDYDEYWPSITADEESMVFTVLVPRDTARFKHEKLPKTSKFFGEDFFITVKHNGKWGHRQPVVSLNTEDNEGAQCLSADGKWMFFTACGKKGAMGSCDIYFAHRTPRGWSKPVNPGPPLNTRHWESQPCFSADGKTLYFASNRPDGKGQKDIWKATLIGFRDGIIPVFAKVVNLGSHINTSDNESSPFIHHDNQTLYFSSDGWTGMGKMDLFISRKNSKGKWSLPENLGYPINTADDETGLVLNAKGTNAYFSSNGLPSETKGKDIYVFKMPEKLRPSPVTYVKGKVFDKETGKELQAEFVLKNIDTGDTIVKSVSDPYTGSFLICLPAGRKYALSVLKPGYLFFSESFNIEKVRDADDPYQLSVYLSPLKPGEKIILKNIFFATDSFELKKESYPELNTVVDLLKKNPKLKVEIGGHTDNVGSKEYNLKLSENRARSVYAYLISKGIDTNRLKYKGYGFSEPVADNSTEEDRAKNRRTELKVIQ